MLELLTIFEPDFESGNEPGRVYIWCGFVLRKNGNQVCALLKNGPEIIELPAEFPNVRAAQHLIIQMSGEFIVGRNAKLSALDRFIRQNERAAKPALSGGCVA